MRKTRLNPILVVALGAIAVWAVFAGVVNPQWSRWNAVQQQLLRKQKELRQGSDQMSQRRPAEESNVARGLSALWLSPSGAEHTAYVAKMMASLCKETGMKLEAIQPMSPRDEETCQRHPTTVTVKGGLAGTTDLLIRINMLKGALDVERLSLRGSSDQGSMTVEMTVASFSCLTQGEPRRGTSRASSTGNVGGR